MPSPEPQDLSSLISKAEKAVSTAARSRARKARPRVGSFLASVLAVALAGAAAFAGYEVRALHAPPSTARVVKDLGTAVDLARDMIEELRRSSGALPEALPSASLAAVVFYEVSGSGYRLSATMGGIRMTMEPDGSRIVIKENEQ